MIMKRFAFFVITILYLVSSRPRLERHTAAFWGSFDTFFVITAYCESKQLFDAALKAAVDSFSEQDKIYNRFDYSPEIVNIAYINRNAYKSNVKVDDMLFSLLQYGIDGEKRTNSKVSPTFGAVSSVWYEQVKKGGGAKPPDLRQLKEAARHTDIKLLKLNDKQKTVRLLSDKASIDAGAFDKGYAVDQVARMFTQMGISRAAVSGGGNIKALDPPDGKLYWEVEIQNPDGAIFESDRSEITVKLINQAIATSGDYQRYFWHDGKRYHHLIDPVTLFPADHYRSVTVVANNAADADLFSTALFVSDFEESKRLAESENLAVLWMMEGTEKAYNQKMKDILIKK